MHRSTLLVAALCSVVLLGCPPAPPPPPPPSPAPQIVAFSASPELVKSGDQVTLSWETKNATKIELNQVGLGLVSGDYELTDSTPVSVQKDALFVLTATNDRGVQDRAAAWVEIDDGPSEVIFFASPSTARAGEPVVLAWNAQGASTVTLAPKGGENIETSGQVASGSVIVRPTAETTYLLTVDGKALETTVGVLPTIDAFVVTPASATPGEPLNVSWKTSAASKVTLSVGSQGVLTTETEASKVADGSFQFTVPAGLSPAPVYTFTLVAEAANVKPDKKQVEVYLAGEPAVVTWNVPTYALTGDTFKLSWETVSADEVQILQDGVTIYNAPSLALVSVGSIDVPTPAADTKFQLKAINHRGGEAISDEKTVSPVGVPSVTTFTTSPQPGIAIGGEKVTLTWNVPNARNVTLSVNNSPVHSETGLMAESGTFVSYPNADTTYVLTADNGVAQSITESRTVTVDTAATLVFSPDNVPAGANIQITGTTVAGTPVGYKGLNNLAKNVAGDAFIDIEATGTALPFSPTADVANLLLTLSQPFYMNFAGVPVGGQSLSVSVDGWMVFSDTTRSASSIPDTSFPTSDFLPQAIVVFGEDLQLDAQAKVLWQDDGVGDQRRIIVQWDNVRICCTAAKRITVQAQLYATGEVVLAYQDFPGLDPSDRGAIGIVNSDDLTAVGPADDLLDSSGRPTPGDTFRMFGEVTLPLRVTASSTPIKISVDMGDGELIVEGAPTLIPADQFRITEVNYNPVSGADQWFEVLNTTESPIDLAGWVIDFGGGITHAISSSTVLPASGRVVLGQTSNATEGVVPVDYVYGPTFTLNSTGAGSINIGMAGAVYTQLSWPAAGAPGASWQLGTARTDLLFASGTTPDWGSCASRQGYGASGQLGSPGAANSYCFWELTPIPGAFTSIAGTGTGITDMVSTGINSIDSVSRTVDFTANGGRAVRIGQEIYGDATRPLRVDSNGYITLSSTTNTASNDTRPSTSGPNGTLAIFWDDLAGNDPGTGASGVYWQQFDPDPLASGDEYTLISWENWRRWASSTGTSTSSLNFQIKILEGTGDIEYHYGTMTASTVANANGANATVWLESLDGTIALPVSVNQPNIQPNTGYRFTAL